MTTVRDVFGRLLAINGIANMEITTFIKLVFMLYFTFPLMVGLGLFDVLVYPAVGLAYTPAAVLTALSELFGLSRTDAIALLALPTLHIIANRGLSKHLAQPVTNFR